MQEKPTEELEHLLGQTGPEKLADFYMEQKQYFADDKKAFYYYFKDILDTKNIFLKDVYSFAGVTESWGSKIVTMEKHTKNRDLILRLCLAGHFALMEINRALKLYGMNPLYAKDRRDAAIIVAIHNRIYDLAAIDDILEKQGFIKLMKDEP